MFISRVEERNNNLDHGSISALSLMQYMVEHQENMKSNVPLVLVGVREDVDSPIYSDYMSGLVKSAKLEHLNILFQHLTVEVRNNDYGDLWKSMNDVLLNGKRLPFDELDVVYRQGNLYAPSGQCT